MCDDTGQSVMSESHNESILDKAFPIAEEDQWMVDLLERHQVRDIVVPDQEEEVASLRHRVAGFVVSGCTQVFWYGLETIVDTTLVLTSRLPRSGRR